MSAAPENVPESQTRGEEAFRILTEELERRVAEKTAELRAANEELKRSAEARLAQLHFLESLERIDGAIRRAGDVEQMLHDVVETVLSILDCDRAWLLYPCDPEAPSFRVPMECTRPEYPGALALDLEVPMAPGQAQDMREALASEEAMTYTLGSERPVCRETAERFHVKAQMFTAVYPKVGRPWLFGVHQCSYPRAWTEVDRQLFREIGRRIADGLSSMLFLRELEQSEARFRALVEQAADAFFLNSLDGKILDVNQHACDSLGYQREELLALSLADIDEAIGNPRSGPRLGDALAPAEPITWEGVHRRKDGTGFPVEVRMGLLELGGEKLMLGLARDVTARKRAEEERKELQGQLHAAQKMEAIGQLAGGMAHDFNNFLTVIIGNAQMAQMALAAGRKPQKEVDGITAAAKQAAGVSNSLLTFCRKTPPHMAPLHLGRFLQDSIRMIKHMLPAIIEISIDASSSDLLWIAADSVQLHQILMNLVVNARDAMPEGGALGIVGRWEPLDSADAWPLIKARELGAAAFLVEDTGMGMSAEVVARVCDPFFTTKPRGQGTGLGMSVVHGIVETHGGQMQIASEVGRGTRVSIAFPRRSPPGTDAAAIGERIAAQRIQATVLLADDEPQVRAVMTDALETAGCQVVQATDGDEAIRRYEEAQGRLDVVILDADMPKKRGTEVLEILRARRPDLPVILISGFADAGAWGEQSQRVVFLRKPFQMGELLESVAAISRG